MPFVYTDIQAHGCLLAYLYGVPARVIAQFNQCSTTHLSATYKLIRRGKNIQSTVPMDSNEAKEASSYARIIINFFDKEILFNPDYIPRNLPVTLQAGSLPPPKKLER